MHRILRHHAVLPRCYIGHLTSKARLLSTINDRPKVVLAIESSCDDSAVAVVKYQARKSEEKLRQFNFCLETLFNERITANNDVYGGIHPLVALQSHQKNLAPLVRNALQSRAVQAALGGREKQVPDLVAVTRGPGMRGNLSVGIDTAKGLALAWNVPLLGVHHMQAHALTPRLISAETHDQDFVPRSLSPNFPFLSVLASGGHTMLINTLGLIDHQIIAETQDIALGDCLDKAARAILPPEYLKAPYGRALEHFAFSNSVDTTLTFDEYTPPPRREEEITPRETAWGWSLGPPLAGTRQMMYTYAGLLTSVERLIRYEVNAQGTIKLSNPRDTTQITIEERKDMAREVQRVAFEHLASRILIYLEKLGKNWKGDTVVVSGGVASNQFLRHVLRSILDVRGYAHVKLSFPPIALCTDNALMIAWAGIEMYEAGYRSGLDISPVRKWSMDANDEDGGILGIGGWHKVDGTATISPP